MSQCKAIKADGQRCTAKAMQGSDYCFFHDPTKKDEAKEAQSRGGQSKTVLCTVKPWRGQPGQTMVIRTPTPEEIVNLLADTIDEVKTGQVDPKVANAVGYLSGVMLKALQYEALEERLQAIEEALQVRERQLRGNQ